MKTSSPPRLLSDKIYEELLTLMGTSEISSQGRLPGENTLAEQFGVSRPVVRQALARLRAEGRIQARKGSGNYVCEPDDDAPIATFGPLTSIPDILSFLEFRCSLEGEIAARAALNHSPETMAEINHRRTSFEEALRNGESGIENDIAFHTAIAQASGNRFFAMTMTALMSQTRFSINLVRGLSADRPNTPRLAQVCREHASIEAAIAAGDADAARQAMAAHLQGGIARLFGK